MVGVFLAPGLSMAEISFQLNTQSSDGVNSFWDKLPQPLSEFIKNARDINNIINDKIGEYAVAGSTQGPINFSQLNLSQFDPTQFLQSILKNSFLTGLYLILVKILHFVGNLFISIFNIIIDLIRQGLSLLH